MSSSSQAGRLNRSAGRVRRLLYFAFYDWTRKMSRSKRILTWCSILIQGYAIYAGFTRSLVWPLMWPKGWILWIVVWLLYMVGACIMNGMLTSEFVRKTQLEADQIAAQQIQQTLQPEKMHDLPGYSIQTYYKPLREVGGDYFDVIELPGHCTLFALADVSGKGMAAALLAANIQALVRSIANVDPDPLAMARQINLHLSRYTPGDRFATAVFVVLRRESGELAYVNAGHNPPLVFGEGSPVALDATGIPLGLWSNSEYHSGTALLPQGGALLLYTDGLTDAIAGDHPESRLRATLAEPSSRTIATLKAMVNPKFNEDDVSILLVRRDDKAAAADI